MEQTEKANLRHVTIPEGKETSRVIFDLFGKTVIVLVDRDRIKNRQATSAGEGLALIFPAAMWRFFNISNLPI